MDWFGDLLLPILSTIVTVAIGLASGAVTRWTGKEIEARHREALHSAIMNGIGYAKSQLTGGGTAQSPTAMVVQAEEYVRQSVPDALDFFGLRKGGLLGDMIAAQVNRLGKQVFPGS